MDLRQFINKILKPYFKSYGFNFKNVGKGEIAFIHKDYNNYRIFYLFNDFHIVKSITTYIWVGPPRFPDENYALYLTRLVDGKEKVNQIFRSEGWYYNTEDELLGILEYQNDIFESWLMDWIFEKKYQEIDIYKLDQTEYDKNFNETSLTEEEKLKKYNERGELLEKWKKTRFYPKIWKL